MSHTVGLPLDVPLWLVETDKAFAVGVGGAGEAVPLVILAALPGRGDPATLYPLSLKIYENK